jgi:phosphatidylglycerol:prolipoprotein diacylglycerol transferase
MLSLIRRPDVWGGAKPALTPSQADDYLVWATLGVILGGRLGYVLFYKPDMLWKNFVEVFQLWNGGMSFHGGLIGVALVTWWFTRSLHVDDDAFAKAAKSKAKAERPAENSADYVKVRDLGWLKKSDVEEISAKTRTAKIDLLRLGDLVAAVTPIGLFIGRIANFINAELYGRQSDAPWAMKFPHSYNWNAREWVWLGGEVPRHPSQLYEAALEGVLLFAIINLAIFRFKSLMKPGLNVGLFLASYGIFRLSLEFVREPDGHMPEALRGVVTMGMLLSLPMILIGAWLIWRALKVPGSAPKSQAA